ncbi:uncharacterized protein LOC107269877 isoform X2 [Cephus cinctus]|uniref:Uncharacterized protein LOC107269877 isoform X2 n=1 Tax=Cephus cinctus TaxID=211228 RepID=A0AAJ7RM05_CEPCN|nr:uncharacterized protein LOC107269877 isoform X2 [Cephus cinctus]
MDQARYVSCIKLNGIPILPPLMTEDIRMEMNYYKQLAMAVEEKLKTLQIAKEAETDKCKGDVPRDYKKYTEDRSNSTESAANDSINIESEGNSVDTTPNTITVIDFPMNEEKKPDERNNFESTDVSITESVLETIGRQWKSISDDETVSCPNEAQLIGSISSDTVTASTDLNHYLNETISTRPNTAETTPETWKPQVPKTLDIVPITVDAPHPLESKSVLENTEAIHVEESTLETPKLVRQGSYVLETPSPMLLAHLQTELANTTYVPTMTHNTIKRKEWNITQAKTEWENQIKNNQFIVSDNSRHEAGSRQRRNSISNTNSQRTCKSVVHTKGRPPLGIRQSTRSVDCIQTMLAKEYRTRGTNNKNNYGQRCTPNACSAVKNYNRWKTNKNVSILNLANKLGGSLGSLSSVNTQPYRCIDKEHAEDVQQNKNFHEGSITDSETQNSKSPLKSVVTSEKLLTIFKEIQSAHEKQMADLMERQRREQSNMQKEFERQQILLLTQIKKTFPGISMTVLPESNSNTVLDKSIPSPHEISMNTSEELAQQKITENLLKGVQKVNEVQCVDEINHANVMKCPLDYIYPANGTCHSSHYERTSSQSTQTSEDESVSKTDDSSSTKDMMTQNYNNDDYTSNGKQSDSSERRHSNVIRQLFPLDSRTTHLPVPDNTLYTENHIRAATIINAYARGYLVRRLMKTENVIALKNTYKEALHCMLKLHVDAPLNLPELNFHQRLQLQCDAASMNIVELFAQCPSKKMQVIAHDREIKKSRSERPSSARSFSFATQRTLARKKLKELGEYQTPPVSRPTSSRTRCQTWASQTREKRSPNILLSAMRTKNKLFQIKV